MDGRKKITFTVYESDYDMEDGFFEPGMFEVFEALKDHFRKKNPNMSDEELTSHTLNEAIYESANTHLGEMEADIIWDEARAARRAKEAGSNDQEGDIGAEPLAPD